MILYSDLARVTNSTMTLTWTDLAFQGHLSLGAFRGLTSALSLEERQLRTCLNYHLQLLHAAQKFGSLWHQSILECLFSHRRVSP